MVKITFLLFRSKKIKCTLVQALRLCTGRKARRGSRGIALPFHDHGTIRGWGVSVTPRPLFSHGKDTVPIVQEAGWAPGPVWTGAENLAPFGIRFLHCSAHSQSLYRLRYLADCVTLPFCLERCRLNLLYYSYLGEMAVVNVRVMNPDI